MIVLAALVGTATLTLVGWGVLRLAERTPVLLLSERLALSFLIGSIVVPFAALFANAAGVPLSRAGWLLLVGALIVLSVGNCLLVGRKLWPSSCALLPQVAAPPGWLRVALLVLAGWTLAKVLAGGVTFLLLTPTFLDDSLDNWNFRAKVFAHEQSVQIVLPGQDAATAGLTVSSYPPAVPLVKAFYVTLAGEWNEALANSVHLLWFCSLLLLFHAGLLRLAGRWWALGGLSILVSLPLLLLHGTNTYADVFLASLLFAAVSFLLHGTRLRGQERSSCVAVSGLAAAALVFTKNEALLLYLPGLAATWCIILWRTDRAERGEMLRAMVFWAATVACILLPWLAYKWTHGMAFGNAKPLTGIALGWQPLALRAIAVQLFFEGNWALLPVAFPLTLLLTHRRALGDLLPLTLFTVLLLLGQLPLYLFTALSAEAIYQTGYGRGLIHLSPLVTLLFVALLPTLRERLRDN